MTSTRCANEDTRLFVLFEIRARCLCKSHVRRNCRVSHIFHSRFAGLPSQVRGSVVMLSHHANLFVEPRMRKFWESHGRCKWQWRFRGRDFERARGNCSKAVQ